jgi:hypothetical protein
MSKCNCNEPSETLNNVDTTFVRPSRTKRWTIEVKEYEDGQSEMTRTNEGFSALELVGLCETIKVDIKHQIDGLIRPSIVNRVVYGEQK